MYGSDFPSIDNSLKDLCNLNYRQDIYSSVFATISEQFYI